MGEANAFNVYFGGKVATGNKVLLIIMDGWGLSSEEKGNAPLLAKTPTLDYIYANYPKTSLSASGLEVGLAPGEPGNSEVGHLNIGSGRVVWENLPRIDQAIENGELAKNEVLNKAFDETKKNNSTLHLIGLVSDGGVHSHIRHLLALIEMAKKAGVKNVLVHFISDGRDTAPKKAAEYAKAVEEEMKKIGVGRIATLIGRYFAMDRDKNTDREKKALDLFINNVGTPYASIGEAIEANYKNGKSDEFIEPAVIGEGGKIAANDTVIIFNHRSDRSRQMMRLLCGEDGGKPPAGVNVFTMTQYETGQKAPFIFTPINLANTLAEVISARNMTQLHTAETEKYAHVTYFFKAGKEGVLKGEKDIVVPSKKVATYDKLPEMAAPEVKKVVLDGIAKGFDFIVVNFANGDMVGHTGLLEAAEKGCEAVDAALSEIMPAAASNGYEAIITADHGNCEMMVDDKNGEPHKEHTTNPVPFIFLDFKDHPYQFAVTDYPANDYMQYAAGTPIGVLADIAPSILGSLGIEKPEEMSGMDLTTAMM